MTQSICWPTPRELDLLRAALLDGESALAAWRRCAGSPLPEGATARLLPLIEWNLRRQGAPAATGTIEQSWLRNEQLFAAVGPPLRDLVRQGMPLTFLKGLALAPRFYPSHALRPVGDVDVLLGPEGLSRARQRLADAGWAEQGAQPRSALLHLHALSFRRSDGLALDLHAYALLESVFPDVDDGFLTRAEPFAFAGIEGRTLAPSDHLLQVCVHGLRWSNPPAVHWVADAVMLLRSAGERVDWAVLVDEARRRQLELTALRALRFLRAEFGAPVADSVLDQLAAGARGLGRRLEAAARMRAPTLLGGLWLHWRNLRRERRDHSPLGRSLLFPSYLRDMWGLAGTWQVPAAAARRSLARLWRREAG